MGEGVLWANMIEQSSQISSQLELEPGSQLPIQIRGEIGNSTITQALMDLQNNHTLGDDNSIRPIGEFLDCFKPIINPRVSTSTTMSPPESLWDQTATAITEYRHLDEGDQQQINGMVDTLLWSLANQPMELNVNGQSRNISPHVQELATTIGTTTDTWSHITKPERHAKQGQIYSRIIGGAVAVAALVYGYSTFLNVKSATKLCRQDWPDKTIPVGFWKTRINPLYPNLPRAELEMWCFNGKTQQWNWGDEYRPYTPFIKP